MVPAESIYHFGLCPRPPGSVTFLSHSDFPERIEKHLTLQCSEENHNATQAGDPVALCLGRSWDQMALGGMILSLYIYLLIWFSSVKWGHLAS